MCRTHGLCRLCHFDLANDGGQKLSSSMAMVIQAPGAWVQVLSHIRSIFGTHHRGKDWFHAIDPPATMPQRGGQEKDTAQGLVIRHEHFLGKRRLGCAYDFQDLAEHGSIYHQERREARFISTV